MLQSNGEKHDVNNKQVDCSSVISTREKNKQYYTNEYNGSWEEAKGSDSLNKIVKEYFSEMKVYEVTP